MMNGMPYVLYALSQIRQQEIERTARTAWQRAATPEPPAQNRRPTRQVRLDTVADGC
jgi:hypothetical protein